MAQMKPVREQKTLLSDLDVIMNMMEGLKRAPSIILV